jgi:glycine cleavage system H protein
MKLNTNVRYTKTHEWVHKEEDLFILGISDYAQHNLGDIVYVDLPAIGTIFLPGAVFGVIESVKAASDLYMPLPGTIMVINEQLKDHPELINKDCYNTGWIIKFKSEDSLAYNNLLSPEEYEKIVGEY